MARPLGSQLTLDVAERGEKSILLYLKPPKVTADRAGRREAAEEEFQHQLIARRLCFRRLRELCAKLQAAL